MDNYIWGIKKVIGSNSLITDFDEEIKREQLKSNIKVENDFISYGVEYNGQNISVTPEHVLAFILEYAYYLSTKAPDHGIDQLKEDAKKCSDENDVVLTVL